MVEVASAIVQTHTWSKSLPFCPKPITIRENSVLWQWSGQQPALVDTRARDGQIRFNGNQAMV